jgi:hypothetical protein
VQNIEHTTTKVENDKDVVPGNIVTFHFDTGWPTHTGIVTDVVKGANGNVVSFTMVDSHSGVGSEERSVTVGDKLGAHINGFYKWDTKPDVQPNQTSQPSQPAQSTQAVKATNAEYNRLIQIANYADKLGLHGAAKLFRNDAEKVKSN